MNSLDPVSVALKFGFLAVLYLFLLWVARSARRDLGGGSARGRGARAAPAPDATGMYSASALGRPTTRRGRPRLVVERAPGHEPGMIYDLDGDLVLGRGDVRDKARGPVRLLAARADLRTGELGGRRRSRLDNGTYLNEELLETPRPLHPGDRVRIGDSEFAFEVD